MAESTLETHPQMGVKVRPSRTYNSDDPGHLAVYWTTGPEQAQKRFRGFGFRISDLPPAMRDPSHWRDYLFQHCVPGVVKDDRGMLDDYLQRREILACGTWPVDDKQRETLESLAAVGSRGWYSFNPDTVASPDPVNAPCHNCVTWGVTVLNQVAGSELVAPIRQGRVKEILAVLTTQNRDV